MATASSVAWSQAGEAAAMLRIACDGPSANADVSINGVFKGQCPVDVPVAGGSVRVRVSKRVDAEREQVFESELQLVGGTAKRVDVELGPVQLNERTRNAQAAQAAQRQAEAQRLAQAQAVQAAQAREAALRAAAEAQAQAQAGDVAAMLTLARNHDLGVGVAQNIPTAFGWYLKAAQGGNAEAMFRVGRRYLYGHGTASDPAQAVAWLRKSAEAGHLNAPGSLAEAWLNGMAGQPADPAQAAVWAQQGVAKDLYGTDGRAAFAMARLHSEGAGGLSRDQEAAQLWSQKAAALGQRDAQTRTAGGVCDGSLPAYAQEVHLTTLRKAAEPNEDGQPGARNAMHALGHAHRTGCAGLQKDDRVARGWFEVSASRGVALAMNQLAWMHWKGEGGLPVDERAALQWYTQSAAAGNGDGMNQLGWFHQHGLGGLSADKSVAADWYRKAHDKQSAGSWDRLRALGLFYILKTK